MTTVTCVSLNRGAVGIIHSVILRTEDGELIIKNPLLLAKDIMERRIKVNNLTTSNFHIENKEKYFLFNEDTVESIQKDILRRIIMCNTHKKICFKHNTDIDLLWKKAKILDVGSQIDKIRDTLGVIETSDKIIIATNKDKLVIRYKDIIDLFERLSFSEINMTNIDTSFISDMHGMFQNANVHKVDISQLNTSNVTYMDYMFCECDLTELILDGIDTSNVTDMKSMFQGTYVNELDLSIINLRNVIVTEEMFSNAKINKLSIPNFNLINGYYSQKMFKGCNIHTLELGSINISSEEIKKYDIFQDAIIQKLIIKETKEKILEGIRKQLPESTDILCKRII